MVFWKNKTKRSWKKATNASKWTWSLFDQVKRVNCFSYQTMSEYYCISAVFYSLWLSSLLLFRDSESRRNDFSLSVRDGDTVKHYRIRQLDEGGFFIARRTTFRTLQELVDHYSRDADGLCVNLRKACIQVRYLV